MIPIKRTSFFRIPISLISKYRVYAKFRTIDNNDIGIPQNMEILMITIFKFLESLQFRGYQHQSFKILWNSDIFIIEISKFRGIPTSLI
jgi:hypothetical protein